MTVIPKYIHPIPMSMKILIVVDYQNDFVTGPLGFEKAKDLEEPIMKKLDEYWARGDMIVFTKDKHDPERYLDTQEGRRLPIPHCIDDEGSAIYGKPAKYCHDLNTVVKDRFGSEDLCARFYFYEGIESIELVGVVGSMCVLSNAVLLKANYPEARIIVDAECVASPDDDMNEKALDIMENLQIDVINRRQN